MGNKPDRCSLDLSFGTSDHLNSSDENNKSFDNGRSPDETFSNIFDNISSLSRGQLLESPNLDIIPHALINSSTHCHSIPHVVEINSNSECEEVDSDVEILDETSSFCQPAADNYSDISTKYCLSDYAKSDLYFSRLSQKTAKDVTSARQINSSFWECAIEAYLQWAMEPWKWCFCNCCDGHESGISTCKTCQFWFKVNAVRQKYDSEDMRRLLDGSKGGLDGMCDAGLDENAWSSFDRDQSLEQCEEDFDTDEGALFDPEEEGPLFDPEDGPRIKYVCRREAIVRSGSENSGLKNKKLRIILSALPKFVKKELKRRRKDARATKKRLFETSDVSMEPLFQCDQDLIAPDAQIFEAQLPILPPFEKVNKPVKSQQKRFYRPMTKLVQSKKKTRCLICPGCLATNCGKCVYCRDMKGFGGPGLKKIACIRRRCEYIWGKGLR